MYVPFRCNIAEENLKQLHDIVKVVQHMKDANVGALSVNSQVSIPFRLLIWFMYVSISCIFVVCE